MTRTTLDNTTQIPIACSLTPAEYRRRVAETGAVAREALRDLQPITGGARLTFAAAPGLKERLEAFVAAESQCCPFLTMQLAHRDQWLLLDVTGPDAAQPIIAELFA